MDVRMPGTDGVAATRRLRETVPDTAVLVLTMYDDDATVFTAMRAGARGYLLKGAEQEEIADAIRAVVRGQAIFGPGIASRLLDHFANPPAPAEDPFPELTPREREICQRLGPHLRERGLLLVGIDVIGGWLTEINVTSPTGIRAVKNVGGPDIAKLVWDKIEGNVRTQAG